MNPTLVNPPLNRVPSATSTRLLNTPRAGDATTSLGSLSRCATTFAVKKFFPLFTLVFGERNSGGVKEVSDQGQREGEETEEK